MSIIPVLTLCPAMHPVRIQSAIPAVEIEDVLSQLEVTDYRLNVSGHNALGGLQCMGMESVHSFIADMPVCCQRDQFLCLVQAPRTSGVGE